MSCWRQQFVNSVIILKTNVILPHAYVILADCGYAVYALWFIAPKTLNYLAFQSFHIEHTWWRLFKKRVLRTKLDVYVFIECTAPPIINRRSTRVISPLSTIFLWDCFTIQTFQIFFIKHFIVKIIEKQYISMNKIFWIIKEYI